MGQSPLTFMTPDEIRMLCDWFLTCDRSDFPDIPFQLTPWQKVTGEGFFDVLTKEVFDTIDYFKGVRSSPPVRLNSILKDLKALQSLVQVQPETFDDW
jgi:hypothetical protein